MGAHTHALDESLTKSEMLLHLRGFHRVQHLVAANWTLADLRGLHNEFHRDEIVKAKLANSEPPPF